MLTISLGQAVVALVLAAAVEEGGPTRSGPNLVKNAAFEERRPSAALPAEWSGDAKVYSCDAAGGRSGSAALKFVNADPQRYRLATQRVPLQPGRRYAYSGWVKTSDLRGEETGATLCIEWQTREGKWLGGSYAHGIKGTRDWTLITGIAQVPEEAGACNLACYVRRGMTGTAWFDDIEVVRLLTPPLRSVVTSPNYRGRLTADGPAAIRALAYLELRDCETAADKLRVAAMLVARPAGKVVATAEIPVPAKAQPTQPLALEIPALDLAVGAYELRIALRGPESRDLHTERHALQRLPDDFRPHATIDAHGRLLVAGRPMFPLGMYFSAIKEPDVRTFADSKFNCLMAYGSPTRPQLDLAQELKLKVIYSIKDWYADAPHCPRNIKTVADEEPAVRARVREYRDHPALLAWYLNDELPQKFLPQLEAHQRFVAEEDPHHPTWAVLYQYNQVADYLRTFDVIGTDPYPIGRKPASLAGAWTAETSRQVAHARPLWQVPQVFNWANYAKSDADRAQGRSPTREEMRSMAWQCIAEGATGLIFYSWYDIRRNPDLPFETGWASLKQIAAEIDRFAPVLLSIEPAPQVTLDGGRGPTWLHSLVRRHENKLYVFAVNDGDGTGDVAFQLPAGVTAVRELTTNREVPVSQSGFRQPLARLAVQVYEATLP